MRKLMNTLGSLNLAALAVLAVLAVSASGCSFVTSSLGADTTETGEAWWVKSKCLGFGLCYASKVYYCPAPSSGPARCKEARLVKDAVAPAAPLPIVQPPPPPAPPPSEPPPPPSSPPPKRTPRR
jgi:hypothetical protein